MPLPGVTALTEAEESLAATLTWLGKKTRYAELVAQRTSGIGLRLDNSATKVEPSPRLLGVVLRVWNGVGWVEGATSRIDRASVSELGESIARRLGAGALSTDPPGDLPTGRYEEKTLAKVPAREDVEKLRAIARQLYGYAKAVRGIDNAFVNVRSSEDERLFLSTSLARRHQLITRTYGGVIPLAKANGNANFDFLMHGGTGGLEVLGILTEARVHETARRSLELLTAHAPPTGKQTVLLDPSASGTFAHESFGHGAEADQILRNRSYLAPLIGQQLGPETVTIVDDGSDRKNMGSIFFDDEGTPTRRTTLVDHGRFVGALHDRESAAALHKEPTGNARRADFLSRLFVRMTNTLVEPGGMSLDELLEEARDGVLLESATTGVEDPLGGNMQLKVKRGRRIEHGELTETLSSMALSGKVLDFLKATRGVGAPDQFESSPGYCGKGVTDMLPVSSGGPYLLSEGVVGPA